MVDDGDKAALNVHARHMKHCLIVKPSARRYMVSEDLVGHSSSLRSQYAQEILALDLYTASLDESAFDVPKAETATASEIRMYGFVSIW
ncbi:hypothetical protein KC361_g155 [Hortaea werneckii]|nr:hypothetical protein KC361_g155 [Hortaea werneckii]